MSAVAQMMAALAGQAQAELAEAESDPEYLLTESGDFIVDPAEPARRADLVAHYFRCFAEASRSEFFVRSEEDPLFTEEVTEETPW